MFVIFIVIFKGYDGFSTLQVGKATGLTVALMLQCCVRLSSVVVCAVTLCIVAKWCVCLYLISF